MEPSRYVPQTQQLWRQSKGSDRLPPMRFRTSIVLIGLWMASCVGDSSSPPTPSAGPFTEPEEHAPAPATPAPVPRTRPTPDLPPSPGPESTEGTTAPTTRVQVGEPSAPPSHSPGPLAGQGGEPVEGPNPDTALEPETEPTVSTEEQVQAEVLEFLLAANHVQPGCLLTGEVPNVPLPSPAALAQLLKQPHRDFAGIAREALVCLLDLPSLTGGEVFGATAFRSSALQRTLNFTGGDREQGVLVTPVVVDQPAGEGALVLVMDARADSWITRSAIYLPWEGDPTTRRLVRLSETKLYRSSRSVLVLKQRDRHHESVHYIALDSTDRLHEVFRYISRGTGPDGYIWQSKLDRTGRRWPRTLRLRSWQGSDVPVDERRWQITRWAAQGENPYEQDALREGPLSLDGARQLLEAGHPLDSGWVWSKLPRTLRRSADALRLKAQTQAARNRHSAARRTWRRAIRAPGATPTVQRDYGLYLASRNSKRRARRALRAYLEAQPDAVDRVQIEQRITELGGR